MHSFISTNNGFRVEKAIYYLTEKYKKSGKNKKPVILHSIRVGMYLLEFGYKTDVVIAGILHDIIEDSNVSANDIKKEFSSTVASWVKSVSFNQNIKNYVNQYKEMFERTISAGKFPVIIKAADILSNSLYIHLVKDLKKQKELLQKMLYFINATSRFSSEPILKELKARYKEESKRIKKLKKNENICLHS